METNFCTKIMRELEADHPTHQIFNNLRENRDEKRIIRLKQVVALADMFGFNDFGLALAKYAEECAYSPYYNAVEAVIFEIHFKRICIKFKDLFELFDSMEADGFEDFPLSIDYSIEEWIVRRSEENSYCYVKDLLKWFYVDFKKLAELQSNFEIGYEVAYRIMQNISYIDEFEQTCLFFKNVNFVVPNDKTYSALEMFLDITIGLGEIYMIPCFKKYLELVSSEEVNDIFNPYWKELEFNDIQKLYIEKTGGNLEIDCKLVAEYGIKPEDSKTIFYNNLMEIVEGVDEFNELKLPKKIVQRIPA